MEPPVDSMLDTDQSGPGPGLAHPPKRALRYNAVLTIVLLALIVVVGNLLVGRHVRVRVDLSEDGLNSMSPATESIVSRIVDPVTVRLFVSEEVEDGQLALRTARIRGQLEEILRLRPDVFELQTLDPTRSSEAQRNAKDAGFSPVRAQAAAMEGGGSGEPVWLSMELTYRARTERIPTPRPFEFETQFASALHGLLADRKPGIGWIGAPIDPPATQGGDQALIAEAGPSYRLLRMTLERRARFSVIEGLETGRSVPDDIDVVFLVRPSGISEKAAYEIARFVQRGGRLILCVDDPDYNVLLGTATFSPEDLRVSPLGRLMKAWGIGVLTEKQIWDGKWQSVRGGAASQGRGLQLVRVRTPMVVTVPDAGMSDAVSPTRGVESARFAWAHPLVPNGPDMLPLPAGISREDLVWTSEDARLDEVAQHLTTATRELRTRMTYLRQKPSYQHVLGAVFSGLFPNPWDDAPPQLSEAAPAEIPTEIRRRNSQVVVFGDADWIRDPWMVEGRTAEPFGLGGGITLAENLVDWLTLDEELIGLRSRAPKPRPLRDFLTEELQEAGVFERDPYETDSERIERDQKSDAARQSARRKQWLTMLLPVGGALLVLALFGALWNLTQGSKGRRGVRSE